jgi:hypothetical protein
LLQSVRAYALAEKQILGLAYGQVSVREEVETGAQNQKKHHGGRRSEGSEGRAWEQAAAAIGPAPRPSRGIHVSERESEVFEDRAACQRLGKDFVIRAFHNRQVEESDDDEASEAAAPEQCDWMALARKLGSHPDQTYAVEVPAPVKKGIQPPKRTAQIRWAWTQIHLPAPSYGKGHPGREVWMVRAGEPDPPAGAEVVEWILLTSLAVNDWDAARSVPQLSECRWRVEDYHLCLKTGCRREDRQLDQGDDLKRLRGFTALLAVRRLQ